MTATSKYTTNQRNTNKKNLIKAMSNRIRRVIEIHPFKVKIQGIDQEAILSAKMII